MYLKGYKIQDKNSQTIILPKWDFGGDTSHTNRAWHTILARIRAISDASYPLSITDLDNQSSKIGEVENPVEFEKWLNSAFKN